MARRGWEALPRTGGAYRCPEGFGRPYWRDERSREDLLEGQERSGGPPIRTKVAQKPSWLAGSEW